MPLFGKFYWAAGGNEQRPGVVLVHTGAGPRDIFLHWRATALAAMGHCVLIADFFSDATGAKWDQVEWGRVQRRAPEMASAATAALAEIRSHPLVDGTRIVLMGFCFGGLPIFNLLRETPASLRAVISFHGALSTCASAPFSSGDTRVLICTGDSDTLVGRPEDVRACTSRLQDAKLHYQVATYGPGVVHAFTNPGQIDAPEGPIFQYDATAASSSWGCARTLLCETTGVPAAACS